MSKNGTLIGRRDFLLGIGSLICACAATSPFDPPSVRAQIPEKTRKQRDFSVVGGAPLRDRAARKGIIYGAAGIQYQLSTDSEYAVRFAEECGILVPGLELKWDRLRPTSMTFDFRSADWLADFARNNNMLFSGTPLVWHEALPAWFRTTVNSQNAGRILRDHITTVVGHYTGKMHSWVVVNEAIYPRDGQLGGLRNTPWFRLLGQQYIDLAFRTASESDPNAMLVYNDHGLDYDIPDGKARRDAVIGLLGRLKSNGTPVHALGIQAHLRGDETRFDPAILRDFLKEVVSLDLKILITEMDVRDQNLPSDISVRDGIVAGTYEDYLSVVLEEPAVIAVLNWGLSDKYTWLSNEAPRSDKAPVRPLPLDENYNRKLSWYAIARAFDKAPNESRGATRKHGRGAKAGQH